MAPMMRVFAASVAFALGGAERSIGDAVQLLQSGVSAGAVQEEAFPLLGKKSKKAKQGTTPVPVMLEKLITREEEHQNAYIIDRIEKLSAGARDGLQRAMASGNVAEATRTVEAIRPVVEEVHRLWSSLKGSEARTKSAMHLQDFELQRVVDALPEIAKDEERFGRDRDAINWAHFLHRKKLTEEAIAKAERDGLPPFEIAKYRRQLVGEDVAAEANHRLAPLRNAVQQAKAERNAPKMKDILQKLQASGAAPAEVEAVGKELRALEIQNAKSAMVRGISEGQRLGPYRQAIQDAQAGKDLTLYSASIDKAEKAGLPPKEVEALRRNLDARKVQQKFALLWAPFRAALKDAKEHHNVAALKDAISKAEAFGLPKDEMRSWREYLRRFEDDEVNSKTVAAAQHQTMFKFGPARFAIAKAEKAGSLAQMKDAIDKAEKAGMPAIEVKAARKRLHARQEERSSEHSIRSAEREGHVGHLARAIAQGKRVGLDSKVLKDATESARDLVAQQKAAREHQKAKRRAMVKSMEMHGTL